MATPAAAELHNASYQAHDLSDGRQHITFLDPFTGEQLRPDRVPGSIEAQPHLRQGLDYLRSRGTSIDLSVYAAPHGDNSVHDMQELIDAFESHDAIFLEGIGHTAVDRDLVWDVSASNKRTITEEEGQRFGPYGQRKLAALVGQNKPTYFADLPADGDSYDRYTMEWNGMVDTLGKMISDQNGDPESLALAMGINLTATTILREWYMLATIGLELSRLDAAGYKSEKPLFLVGQMHGTTLLDKAAVLGVHTSVTEATMAEHGESRTVSIPFDFVKAVGACAIETER